MHFFSIRAVPPVWKTVPTDIEAIHGDSILLNCQGFGKPEPSILWLRSTGRVMIY